MQNASLFCVFLLTLLGLRQQPRTDPCDDRKKDTDDKVQSGSTGENMLFIVIMHSRILKMQSGLIGENMLVIVIMHTRAVTLVVSRLRLTYA